MKHLAFVVMVVVMALPAGAQPADPPFPVEGVVIKPSPVFGPREDIRALVVILPGGATIRVLGRDGFWYRVAYSTPQGEREGMMEPTDIAIAPDALTGTGTGLAGRISQRGFVELRGSGFPQTAVNDTTRSMGDVLLRQEMFVRPVRWMQVSAGLDLRASSRDDVESSWQVDVDDRGLQRARAGLRRLSVALTSRHVSLDIGKQFVRWGRADILSPVDRFAPRDYLNVIDSEFVAVSGARASVRAGGETVEVVWVPQMTPSRLPLLGQRWSIVPAMPAEVRLEDRGAIFPGRAQVGIRWSHAGRFEVGLSVFDGYNHLPEILVEADAEGRPVALTRTYAALRSYGAELSLPTSVLTVKGEAAWFTSPEAVADEFVLYVVEVERQMGEWLLDAGYVGEAVTAHRGLTSFGAERGLADSFIGRASYTIDPRRSVEFEGAGRRNGEGLYVKGEYSQTFGRHWRATVGAAAIRGSASDFLGQYQRNSHLSAVLRLSY